VTLETGSRLERIEESAFQWSGSKLIEIPGSVTFINDSAFPVAEEEEEEEEVEEQEFREEALNAQNR
jgi:hypothetical protein